MRTCAAGCSWRASTAAPITEEEFASTFGQTSREIIARFWGAGLDGAAREALDARKEAIYRDLIRADFPAMDGAVR